MTATLTTVEPQATLINADRRLAFQFLTAFGSGRTQVLEQRKDDGAQLVRFTTPLALPLIKLTLVTEEWVRGTQPERIRFHLQRGRGIMASFAALEDSFILEERDGMTWMTYESAFALRGGLIGRMAAPLVARLMRRFMVAHLEELRHAIEQRAARSKLYPQRKPNSPNQA